MVVNVAVSTKVQGALCPSSVRVALCKNPLPWRVSMVAPAPWGRTAGLAEVRTGAPKLTVKTTGALGDSPVAGPTMLTGN